MEVLLIKRPSTLVERDMLDWFYNLGDDNVCYFRITGGQYKGSIGQIIRNKVKMTRERISRNVKNDPLNWHYSCQQSLFLSFSNRPEIVKINAKYFAFLGTNTIEEVLIYKNNILESQMDVLGQLPKLGDYAAFSKNNKINIGVITKTEKKYSWVKYKTGNENKSCRIYNGAYVILSDEIHDRIADHILAYGKIVSPIEVKTFIHMQNMENNT